MTTRILAQCQLDLDAEWRHLASWLPDGIFSGQSILSLAPACASEDDGLKCAVLAWARSGLMDLTGTPTGPPLAPTAPVLPRTQVLVSAIALLAARRDFHVSLKPRYVLGCRAAESGFSRRGTVSANGSCRLLRASDGWLAVNLARDADIRSVPAVLGRELVTDSWTELTAHASVRLAAATAASAQLVGIPAAELGAVTRSTPVEFQRVGEAGEAPRLVLDLSAMWAGPLCASILQRAGWRVLKVEDARRPDGARLGPRRFYAELHADIPVVQLDFGSPSGRTELARLASHAGMIVESSRPRALRGLGIVAEEWLQSGPGRAWISVTGYGRSDRWHRVAFGDDAAVGGGLVAWSPDGMPVFCGDAIADPLTGLHAGLAALAAQAAGGGLLVDAAMASVCADVARPTSDPAVPHPILRTKRGWSVSHGRHDALVQLARQQ